MAYKIAAFWMTSSNLQWHSSTASL